MRHLFAYARHRGYDLPPYPLAGCGEIRAFFADEGVRNVPDWYGKKLGLDERAYEALPSQTVVVVRDRADQRDASPTWARSPSTNDSSSSAR